MKILSFGSPILDSYLLVEEGVMEQYGITKGKTTIFDELVIPPNIQKMQQEHKFTDFEMGGSAINTVKGYAFLGGEIGLVCSYGKDQGEELIISESEKMGMKLYGYPNEKFPTSYLTILVTPDGQRTVAGSFYPSFQLESSKVDYSTIKDYDYSLIESYSFSNDPSHDSVFKTLENVEKYEKKFIFALSNPFCTIAFKDEVTKFMNHKCCKVVMGNAQEYLNLYPDFTNLKDLMNHLLEYNRSNYQWEILIATDGADGAWLLHKDKLMFVPAPSVKKVIDTTGAGDYFASGALYALMNNLGLEAASHLGNLFAADIISRVGVKLSSEVIEQARAYITSIQ